ncbi:cyclic pyranopterin monophosphate synthase accessory protein [Betaproteobacteria bacterium]|nr:cyclic pyranopterin monophosphate synthase accessory protein [Betaproteobacteria bacterium]GHU20031.1 cyclic pyranopterin monophosphate synthase accessory protein [Betaproteobacteria bacterium]
MSEPDSLTHFSAAGRARMVDVSAKAETRRVAIASGILRMQPATLARIRAGTFAKGNVLAVADVAAVMGAKRTAEMIPMCHPLALTGVEVEFSEILAADAEGCVGIKTLVTTRTSGQTGVEMEALCAVNAALLSIYDMCKAIDRGMRIENIQLEEKRGGKSGLWQRDGFLPPGEGRGEGAGKP